MVKEEDKLTIEELYNNLEFKIAKKLLKIEFPWIKDLIIYNPDTINNYNLIFVEPVIDGEEVAQKYGLEIGGYVNYYLRTDGKFFSPYLSTMFTTDNDSTNISIGISDKIDRMLRTVHNNPAIPDTMRLPKDRRLSLGGFVYKKEQPPTD